MKNNYINVTSRLSVYRRIARRKKVLVIVLFYFLLSTFYPSTTLAHVLKTSGSIGAVLHISPEDDPIIGERSSFFFEFKDKNYKFKSQNCDCKVFISQGGKEIFSEVLFKNNSDPNLENASFTYIFPEKDIYSIKVVGKPVNTEDFEAFELKYDIRVSREDVSKTNNNYRASNPNWILSHTPHLIGVIIILGFVIFAVIKERIKKST